MLIALLATVHALAREQYTLSSPRLFHDDSDGVMLVNVLHKKQPLTVFDTDKRKVNLPAMLSDLSREMLPNQVFDLKYESFQNKIWLELKKDPFVKTRGLGDMFHATRTDSPAFTYVRNVSSKGYFQMLFDGKCLTVGNSMQYNGAAAWMLSFKPCVNGDEKQVFAMVPSLRATTKLGGAKSPAMERKKAETADRIRRIIDTVGMRQAN